MSFLKRIAGTAILGAALLGTGPFLAPAEAGYVVTLTEQGGNVVATGSGPIDLTGLTGPGTGFTTASIIIRNIGFIITGPGGDFDPYLGITGPASFGTGSGASTSNGSGDI